MNKRGIVSLSATLVAVLVMVFALDVRDMAERVGAPIPGFPMPFGGSAMDNLLAVLVARSARPLGSGAVVVRCCARSVWCRAAGWGRCSCSWRPSLRGSCSVGLEVSRRIWSRCRSSGSRWRFRLPRKCCFAGSKKGDGGN